MITPIPIQRTDLILRADPRRVLVRPFNPTTPERARKICARVLALPETEVHALLEQVETEFGERHRKTREFFHRRYLHARQFLPSDCPLSEQRSLLIGAHFSHEYSLEAAALFNPSLVPHPDQSDLPPGSLRFILSLRATGEGHISSVTFRTGFLARDGQVTVNEPTRYCLEPAQVPAPAYEKPLFERKLQELGLLNDFSRQVLQGVENSFTLLELTNSVNRAFEDFRARGKGAEAEARK